MTNVEITALLDKYLWNELTPDEKCRLERWISTSEKNERLFKSITQEGATISTVEEMLSLNEFPDFNIAPQPIPASHLAL